MVLPAEVMVSAITIGSKTVRTRRIVGEGAQAEAGKVGRGLGS